MQKAVGADRTFQKTGDDSGEFLIGTLLEKTLLLLYRVQLELIWIEFSHESWIIAEDEDKSFFHLFKWLGEAKIHDARYDYAHYYTDL